jgi:PAS domain S-box-containing protein
MRTISGRSRVYVFTALATGAAALAAYAGWPQAQRIFEFSGLILAASLVSALAVSPAKSGDAGAMSPSFVVEFSGLLLLGPQAALVTCAIAAIARQLADPHPIARMLIDGAVALGALEAAALVHATLGGSVGHFAWPWQGLPIAAAVAAYCLVKGAANDLVVPLATKGRIDRAWARTVARNCPGYFIGAAIAIGAVEVIGHRTWEIVPIAAVPLFFAYQAYCADIRRREEEYRRREVVDSLEQGMCVVDSSGQITLWNDALERLMACSRENAVGRPLAAAVPAISQTELPRAIKDAVESGSGRTLPHVGLPAASGPRILSVKIVPVSGGVTLLWNDITERTRAEQALKRNEERLALAAEGANDGLWEWDLRTQAFYVSSRWKAQLGLEGPGSIGRPEEWIDRVHADDVAGLKEALKGYLAGGSDYFHNEHRIRHENGTYRRFLCRGVAVRGASARPVRIAGSLTDTTER